METEKSNTQSEELAALLKKHGLQAERFPTVESVLEELASSKKKIRADSRTIKKLSKTRQQVQTTEDDESIKQLFPDDPNMQKLARENRELKQEQMATKRQIWEMQNPDYGQFEERVEELIDTDPDVMRVTDPLAQLNMALRLARAEAGNSGGATGTPREAGGLHLAQGAIGVTTSPAVPVRMSGAGMSNFDTEYGKLIESFEKELDAAKGDEAKQDEIHAKYKKKEEQLRRQYGKSD